MRLRAKTRAAGRIVPITARSVDQLGEACWAETRYTYAREL